MTKNKHILISVLLVTLFISGNSDFEEYVLIPEGFGAMSKGGEKGNIYYVTSLLDNNEKGTLRWAIEKDEPRIIKFKVSGIIQLKESLDITNPFITIDGIDELTKGNKGITIRDFPINIRTHDVIIRFVRIRLGDYAVKKRILENNWKRHKGSGDLDCINIHQSNNILIDHVSMSWSCDEIVSVTNSTNVTIQWSIMSEPLSDPILHPYGDNHAYCSNNSASTITYHHCLFAHYVIRGPQFEANDIISVQLNKPKFEAINNVCYAFTKSGSRYSGAFDFPEKYLNDTSIQVSFQFIANKYINTSQSSKSEIECIDNYGYNMPIYCYIKGNIGEHNKDNIENQLALIFTDGKAHFNIQHEKNERFGKQLTELLLFKSHTPVEIEHPDTAYTKIIRYVGCYLKRDKHDNRVINDLLEQNEPRIISTQETVGGWETYNTKY
jgi:pectate lyase